MHVPKRGCTAIERTKSNKRSPLNSDVINPFVPIAPSFYPLNTSENCL